LFITGLCAVAFLEFLFATAWAWVVAANVFQGVARRFLVAVVAVRAMHVAVIMAVCVIVVVVAVRAVDVFLLGHASYSGM
jgi:hypothetical protein